MHQSTIYERILMEGRVEGRLGEAQRFVRRLGKQKFGEPDPACAAVLDGIQDVDRLEALGDRILLPEVKSWEDLLKGE